MMDLFNLFCQFMILGSLFMTGIHAIWRKSLVDIATVGGYHQESTKNDSFDVCNDCLSVSKAMQKFNNLFI